MKSSLLFLVVPAALSLLAACGDAQPLDGPDAADPDASAAPDVSAPEDASSVTDAHITTPDASKGGDAAAADTGPKACSTLVLAAPIAGRKVGQAQPQAVGGALSDATSDLFDAAFYASTSGTLPASKARSRSAPTIPTS
ncbi:hypothetical protein BH09MYX1_BH09MYX1_06270 [soil metagenome]